jgi:hypothetical protein
VGRVANREDEGTGKEVFSGQKMKEQGKKSSLATVSVAVRILIRFLLLLIIFSPEEQQQQGGLS